MFTLTRSFWLAILTSFFNWGFLLGFSTGQMRKQYMVNKFLSIIFIFLKPNFYLFAYLICLNYLPT
jgi:hypothetical protein